MVSIRKKRRRAETPDDAIEPFSPGGFDPDFDDIDPDLEPEPQAPSVPPLVQARLRASPSIQTLEHPVEKASDPNKECYQALLELCARVRWHISFTPAPSAHVSTSVRKGPRLRRRRDTP
jgi:hypothetical protein